MLFHVNIFSTSFKFVDFDYSMKQSPEYTQHKDELNEFKILYHRTFENINNYSTIGIPKIIHQIWIGSPLPEKCRILQQTWIKNHPTWQYILWTDEKINTLGLKNQYVYDLARNPAEKSDIARYEILYRFGGLYVDTDFESIQPMDFLNEHLDFYTGIAYGRGITMYNGLIASMPKHPILELCINNIKQCTDNRKNKTWDIMERTGPFYFTECCLNTMKNQQNIGTIVFFPVSYFYPWPNHIVKEVNPHRWIGQESLAIHHWHSSWMD